MREWFEDHAQILLRGFVILFVFSLLGVAIVILIGVTTSEQQISNSSNTEETSESLETSISIEKVEVPVIEEKEDSYELLKKALDPFLESYYTYEAFGENFESYKEFLLPEVRESWRDRTEKEMNGLNSSTLVRSEYVSSQFFISNPSFAESQVICRVRNNFDQLDGNGDFLGVIENQMDVLITVKRQGEALYVKEIRGIQIIE